MDSLIASIDEIGLLQPIVVDTSGGLLAGRRRLVAVKSLDWSSVPCYVAKGLDDALGRLFAERDENTCRKDFAITEAVSLGLALEKLEKPKAKKRRKETQGRPLKTGGNLPPVDSKGKTRDKVAPAVGMSPRTYEKAKAVVESGDAELIAEMDKGKVDGVFRKLLGKRRVAEEQVAAKKTRSSRQWTITADQEYVTCSAVITDPPYGILDEPWEPDKLEPFTCEWAGRWNDCEADTFTIFWSQRYLWEGRSWFDEALTKYDFQQLLVWHYPNNKSPQSRKGFKQTWEPVFFYRRRESDRQVIVGGTQWGDGLNDFDCHVAAVPQTNFNDADMKQHPAQKPVAVMKWLINALTVVGEMVADPFCGSGTTGIAAMQLGRRFHGIEIDKKYTKIAKGRIASYGKAV